MPTMPHGHGYWLVAPDGGIFSFDAPFYVSLGSEAPSAPIVAMTGAASGTRYRLVDVNGAVFKFSSTSLTRENNKAVVAVDVVPQTREYNP